MHSQPQPKGAYIADQQLHSHNKQWLLKNSYFHRGDDRLRPSSIGLRGGGSTNTVTERNAEPDAEADLGSPRGALQCHARRLRRAPAPRAPARELYHQRDGRIARWPRQRQQWLLGRAPAVLLCARRARARRVYRLPRRNRALRHDVGLQARLPALNQLLPRALCHGGVLGCKGRTHTDIAGRICGRRLGGSEVRLCGGCHSAASRGSGRCGNATRATRHRARCACQPLRSTRRERDVKPIHRWSTCAACCHGGASRCAPRSCNVRGLARRHVQPRAARLSQAAKRADGSRLPWMSAFGANDGVEHTGEHGLPQWQLAPNTPLDVERRKDGDNEEANSKLR